MLYAYAITGNKEYLQYAYKWNELIEVLSFSLSGKKSGLTISSKVNWMKVSITVMPVSDIFKGY